MSTAGEAKESQHLPVALYTCLSPCYSHPPCPVDELDFTSPYALNLDSIYHIRARHREFGSGNRISGSIIARWVQTLHVQSVFCGDQVMSGPDATQVFDTEERELIARREGLDFGPLEETQVGTPTDTDSAFGGDASESEVFARLVPSNDAARIAFHEVALACQNGKILPHHKDALFIRESGHTPACSQDAPASSSSDSEGPASIDGQDSQSALLQGHFGFLFDHQGTGFTSNIGYRIGKGTSKAEGDRSVDILIIPPPSERSSRTKQLANGVASIHSLIQVHPDSGALMLVSMSNSRPVVYLDSDEEPLFKGNSHVLFRKKNTFWLGNMQFCFEYTMEPGQYQKFEQKRNAYLQRLHPGRPLPHPAILAVPREGIQKIDVALVHESLSSGAFGMVSAGVHKLTGEPLAIKELWIKESRHVFEVKKEAEISNEFSEVGNPSHFASILKFGPWPRRRQVLAESARTILECWALIHDEARDCLLCRIV